ncbi:MAG: alpha/beta hydrolase [Clostridium sp.]|nr:alpha/beta hydrolase [Clostridium sp.]
MTNHHFLLRMIWGLILPLCFSVISMAQNMRQEADSFLESLPAGLQNKQAEAVRQATAGNTAALEAIRNSRNTPAMLSESVDTLNLGSSYRLYLPKNETDSVLPLLIYLHGGGWCFGSINSCANFCSALAERAGMAVLAVEYPLAPEHPYPAALNACTQAMVFARKHAAAYGINPQQISIGGDSSGGNLALSTTFNLLMASSFPGLSEKEKEEIPMPCALVLFYPVTKVWTDGSLSWRRYAEGFGLDTDLMEAFNEAYIPAHSPLLPLVSPAMASDSLLMQLPPTLIVNAERDILSAQGEELAGRLARLGVPMRHATLPGTVHLFITVGGQPAAFQTAVDLATVFLRQDIYYTNRP